jgi:arginase
MGKLGWIGLREVDKGEQDILRMQGPGYVSTLYDVDRRGIESEVQRLDAWLRTCGAKNLYVSFDVDVMDPILAPGTGTAVRGGLTYRETQLIAELMCENLRAEGCPYRLAGLEIVETNPIPDQHNETAVMAVEWLASLFGKTILGCP